MSALNNPHTYDIEFDKDIIGHSKSKDEELLRKELLEVSVEECDIEQTKCLKELVSYGNIIDETVKFSHYKNQEELVKGKLQKVRQKNEDLRLIIKKYNKQTVVVQRRIEEIERTIEDSTKSREAVFIFHLQQS